MLTRRMNYWILGLLLTLLMPVLGWAQNFNGSISGMVTDPSAAVIPGAQLTLIALGTKAVAKTTTNEAGLYAFPNLVAGAYELTISASSFRDYVQTGIVVLINQSVRQDVRLEVGISTQTVEVSANASPLDFENGEVKHGLTPETIAELPLLGQGGIRAVGGFAVLLPGVTSGETINAPFASRFNGATQQGEEAIVDGASMVDGMYQTSGLVEAIVDHPLSVESISEVSVLTSNFDPQYGNSAGAVFTSVTKSGTNEFHGGFYEFLRNTVLNARPYGVPDRPKFIQNDFGGNIGGPAKIPGLWSGRRKTYFFFNYEDFRIRGGSVAPILSIPSLKERQGDFSDWVDASGNLIPVYDPATTRPNPNFDPNLSAGPNNLSSLRDQFMGCDGQTPNVICPSDPRLVNSLANAWFKFLPTPTYSGPLNNYAGTPVPAISFGRDTFYDFRVDHYIGEKEHISISDHYVRAYAATETALPGPLATESHKLYSHRHVARLNWDHTFSPSLLNHATLGFNNIHTPTTGWNQSYVDQFPKIAGVAAYLFPPTVDFQNFSSYGWHYGDQEKQSRPVYSFNDRLSWVRGKHTLEFGGSIDSLDMNNLNRPFESGDFSFDRLTTGLLGVNSGNSIASFILGAVATGNVNFLTVETQYARQRNYGLYGGDTWRVSPKLSVNYGLRWDVSEPASEKFNHLSFLDPLGANPGAGGRPGRLAFAGSGYGAASFGSPHPEQVWYKGFAPRLGIAYSVSPNTVVRAGYGIFFMRAFYTGWNGGIAQDGFNNSVFFSATNGGITPAFFWQDGFPQDFQPPPFIDPSFLNGKGAPMYRPFDANRLPYSQEWNLTIEHQFTNNFYVSASYVGSKGTRLNSGLVPINALNPSLLSMGQSLYDQFQPGQTTLDGVSIPYAGWVEQMTACPPSVAQALLPYPQYCGGMTGLNENAGSSIYHSFQVKAEKRVSHGVYMLTSYTLSKLLSNADNEHADVGTRGISPFERQRNKSLAADDTPQVLSVAFTYQLPFGQGKHFLNTGSVVNKLVGGWTFTNIFRATSGNPLTFYSSQCNVPGQFQVACLPALPPGANPFAQSGGSGSFDPNKPLFNSAAFEDINSFNFYFGQGPRVSNLRGFGYHNQDLGLIKETRLTERFGLQFRAEFFNVWNWHCFTGAGYGNSFGGAFTTDVASPEFGMWNGNVTSPRTIQFGMKLMF